jgi:NAD(P)-dependent dehydrogenase (short-subunit alcohol dehydrogenase family)
LRTKAATLAEETGSPVHALSVDTLDDASVDCLVAETVRLLGGLDIVVNAAAQPGPAAAPGVGGVESARFLDDLNSKLVAIFESPARPPLIWSRPVGAGSSTSAAWPPDNPRRSPIPPATSPSLR